MNSQKTTTLLTRAGHAVNWRALGVGAFRINLVIGPIWTLFLLIKFRQNWELGRDFFVYYRAEALHAYQHGWQAYYGADLNNQNPPLQGLLLFPFLPFAPWLSYALWSLFSLGCLFLVWRLLSARQWWQFPILLLLAPVLYNLGAGQVVLIIAAIIALAWWLSERERGLTAGMVLSLATLKPQLILLLPLVLLLGGRKREFAGFALGCLAIGLLSLGLVGVGGIEQMLANQQRELGNTIYHGLIDTMILRFWFPGLLGLAMTAGAILFTLGLAWRIRGASAAPLFAIGLLGSMLATPYLHIEDLILWVLVYFLLERSCGLPRGLVALGAFCSWLPLFGVPLVSLGGLLVVLLRRRRVVSNRLAEAARGD